MNQPDPNRFQSTDSPPALPVCEMRGTTPSQNLFHCWHRGVRTPGRLVTREICAVCTIHTVSSSVPGPRVGISSLARKGKEFAASGTMPAAPDHFAIIACHFNPAGFRNPICNYWRFREALGDQLAQQLITVELSFNGRFTIPDAIQLQGGSENLMWQKEALLNLALRRLPERVRYVAWIDTDVVFHNSEWATTAVSMLADRNVVVQLFDHVAYMRRDGRDGHCAPGVVWQRTHAPERKHPGQPGMAWAARRDYLDSIGGLLATHVLGGGDRAAADAWLKHRSYYWNLNSPELIAQSRTWADLAGIALAGRQVGYVPGRLTHLYHGSLDRRLYRERTEILTRHRFDPVTDVRLNSDGIWEWAADKPELHHEVAEYFIARREDD